MATCGKLWLYAKKSTYQPAGAAACIFKIIVYNNMVELVLKDISKMLYLPLPAGFRLFPCPCPLNVV